MRAIVIALSCLVGLFLGSTARADDATDLVAEAVKVAGGRDKLPKILRWKETWFLGDSTQANAREALLVFPSKWYQDGKDIAVGNADRAEKAYLVWVWSLGALVEKGSTLKLLPDSKLNERAIRGVRVEREGQKPIDVFFDAETKKLARIDWREFHIGFSDWKETDGFRYPANAFVRRKDGTLHVRTEFQVVEVLKEVPAELGK